MKRLVTAAVLVALSLLLGAALPVNAQAQNLLVDPGFEGETYIFVSADPLDQNVTYSVPAGWGGGVALSPRSQPWMNIHPTGFPNIGVLNLSGPRSFHMARGFATFTAWLYQQVRVQPGTPVQGGAWGFIENASGTSIVRAGIDPTGGSNPFAGSVVWSPWGGSPYQWNHVSVNSVAVGDVVTLFLFATQALPADPNGVYWDNAYLYGTAGAAPAAGGQPSGGQYITPTVRLSVRSGPGTDYRRLGVINPGEAFAVLGQSDGWYTISYNGQTAYVSAQYVTAASGPSSQPAATVASLNFTLSYTVRLRSGPGTNFETLDRIPFNTTVTAIGRTSDGAWVQVTYNGRTGWVASRYGRASGNINGLPVTG